jgi:hypothetical protein
VAHNATIQSTGGAGQLVRRNGYCGGNAEFMVADIGNGNVGGSGRYSSYNNCVGMTAHGDVAVTGRIAGSVLERLDITSTGMEFRIGNTDYFYNGTIGLTYRSAQGGNPANYVITFNGNLLRNGATVLMFQNFTTDALLPSGSQRLAISGLLRDASAGWVDVSTPFRATLNLPNTAGSSGTVYLTGNAQRATVTYSSNGSYTVVINPYP